jgi:hypothetical protein
MEGVNRNLRTALKIVWQWQTDGALRKETRPRWIKSCSRRLTNGSKATEWRNQSDQPGGPGDLEFGSRY